MAWRVDDRDSRSLVIYQKHIKVSKGMDLESLRFRFRYFPQNQIWTPAIVKSSVYTPFLRIHIWLQYWVGHWWQLIVGVNYHWCPDLNLSELSKSESDAKRTHLSAHLKNVGNIEIKLRFALCYWRVVDKASIYILKVQW